MLVLHDQRKDRTAAQIGSTGFTLQVPLPYHKASKHGWVTTIPKLRCRCLGIIGAVMLASRSAPVKVVVFQRSCGTGDRQR